MAFKDSWHRALVYFGLAEERNHYDDQEPIEDSFDDAEVDEGQEPLSRRRPNIRRLSTRRRRDDIDEIFSNDTVDRNAAPLRAIGGRAKRSGTEGGDVRVHLVVPKSFNDAQQVADKFKDTIPVILNLQGIDAELSKRLIDFSSGLTYAMDGGMQRIAEATFLLTPRNVEVSAQERARLIEKGFFNQS